MIQCPKCSFAQPEHHTECPRCGIIIDKYRRLRDNLAKAKISSVTLAESSPGTTEFIKELLFYAKPETNLFIFGGRAPFFIVIVIWGYILFIQYKNLKKGISN